MPKLKIAREIKFYVNITYKEFGDHTEQIFSFVVNNKKYLSYAFDKRYLLKRKLDKLYDDYLLDGFLKRIDCKDKVIFFYTAIKEPCPKATIVNESFYLPPYNGCKYCTKAVSEGEKFLFCPEKNKHFGNNGIKNCKVFSSIEEVLT